MSKGHDEKRLHESWRERIKASHLLNNLIDFAEGNRELTSGQIKATEILLKKVFPDLQKTVLESEDGGLNFNVTMNVRNKPGDTGGVPASTNAEKV